MPKVTKTSAGIARFLADHFNIINGEVSIKSEIINTSNNSKGVYINNNLPEEEDRYDGLIFFDIT